MNNEVTRLRRLRKTALKVRALALSLSVGKPDGSLYARAALLNWRMARIATGRLRAHPYRNYQKDPGYFERGVDRINAYVLATLANIRGEGMRIFLEEVIAASRELDDTRALTLSTDLSESLGRAQGSMRRVIDEIRAQVALESGQIGENGAGPTRLDRPGTPVPAPHLSASPYLAL